MKVCSRAKSERAISKSDVPSSAIYISHESLKDILGSMDLWYCVAQLVETAMPRALLPWLAAGECISGACYKQRRPIELEYLVSLRSPDYSSSPATFM